MGSLRAEAGRAPHDRALTELVGELSVRSQEFRVRWAAHDMAYYRSGTQPFHHPLVGALTLDYDALELPADPGLTIVAYTAEPGSPAARPWTCWPAGPRPPIRRRPSAPTTPPEQGAHPCLSSPSRRPPKARPNGSPATSSSTPSPRARSPRGCGSAPSGSPRGARTAWHAHAVGQTLYVTEGKGLVQSRGGAVEEIRAGDIITTPPDEWHWHGAAPDHYMTHLSITEAPGDQRPEAVWGEHVTDDEYRNR